MQQMGHDYEVSVHKVIKNNNIQLDSLIIRKQNSVIMPSIYLNSFYDEFCNGKELRDIVREIVSLYEEHRQETLPDFSLDFEDNQNRIFFRLVNRSRNDTLLATTPHYVIGDYAAIFHCMVFIDGNRCGTIRLSADHFALWNKSPSDLLPYAAQGSLKLSTPTLRPIEEVIEEILWDSLRNYSTETSQAVGKEQIDELLTLLLHKQNREMIPMYVLSNHSNSYGASSLLNLSFLNQFKSTIGEDFYILPSSIHEAILIPQSKAPDKEHLKKMVADINASQVPEQEYLADEVYLYSEFLRNMPEELLQALSLA